MDLACNRDELQRLPEDVTVRQNLGGHAIETASDGRRDGAGQLSTLFQKFIGVSPGATVEYASGQPSKRSAPAALGQARGLPY